MEISEIKSVLTAGNRKAKIEMLSHLDDVFESYNKNTPMLNEIVQFLVNAVVLTEDPEIVSEILDTIVTAQIYQNVEHVDFDILESCMDNAPEEITARIIDILGYTHDVKYAAGIQYFRFHHNYLIRNSVQDAMRELRFSEGGD